MSLPALDGEARVLLARCRERFAATMMEVLKAEGLRLPELLDAANEAAHATFDELAGLKSSKDFEQQRGLTASRISLVHMEDMDLTVAMINLAQKLTDASEGALSQLHLRFMTLLGQDEAVLAQVPVGAEAACSVLRAVCDQGALDTPIRMGLPARIEAPLAHALVQLYGELDTLLAEAGVEPKSLLRSGGVQPGRSGMSSAGGAPAHASAPHSASGNDAIALNGPFGLLRSAILRRTAPGKAGSGHGGGGLDPSLAAAISDRVLGWLTDRQRGEGSEVNLAEVALLLSPAAALTLETLSVAFDALLTHHSLPASARPVLAALRIPLFKVALIEPDFLADPKHPVRQCLDNVLVYAMRLETTCAADDPALRRLDEAVRALRESFARDFTPFEILGEQTHGWNEERAAQAEALASPLSHAVEREAKREQVRRRAAQAVRALTATETPLPIRDFLEQIWTRVLAAVLSTHGERSQQWMDALSAADRLLWSVRPKSDPKERADLVAALPGILEQIKRGLDLVGMPEKMREPVMQRFVAFHAAALHGRTHEAPPTPRSDNGKPRVDISEEHPHLRLVRLPPDGDADARAPDWVQTLKIGDWLDLQMPEGERLKLRIGWLGGAARTYMAAHAERDFVVIFPQRWFLAQIKQGAAAQVPDHGFLEAAAESAYRGL